MEKFSYFKVFGRELVGEGNHRIYLIYDLSKFISMEKLENGNHIIYSLTGKPLVEVLATGTVEDYNYEELDKTVLATSNEDFYYTNDECVDSAAWVYNKDNDTLYLIRMNGDDVYACAPKYLELPEEERVVKMDFFAGIDL